MNNTNNKREVCFLIGEGDVLLYADYSESPTALPDAQKRWQEIWDNRHQLIEIAHSHPLGGSNFSQEDETTMAALDLALGKSVCYSVVSPDEMRLRDGNKETIVEQEPWWANLMRVASGINPESIIKPLPKEE